MSSPASGTSTSAAAFTVDVVSVNHANGAYDAEITTRPGAAFSLMPGPAAPAASASLTSMPTAATAPVACTGAPKRAMGLLTTYAVHCPSQQLASPIVQVRLGQSGANAAVLVPLASTRR